MSDKVKVAVKEDIEFKVDLAKAYEPRVRNSESDAVLNLLVNNLVFMAELMRAAGIPEEDTLSIVKSIAEGTIPLVFGEEWPAVDEDE